MPNYLNGKIYKITGINEKGEWVIYIGSTCQKLSSRMTGHRRDTNACKSKIIIETCENITITLIKNYPCNTKEELTAEERSYYDKYDCVNAYRPILYPEERENYQQTYYKEHKEERVEYQQKYNQEHKEEILEYQQKYQPKYYEENKKEILEKQTKYNQEHKEERVEYYKEHKEELAEYQQKYREEHKEEILEYHQKYREEHKEEKAEKNAKNYDKNKCEFKCDCGSTINNKLKIKAHEKTKKHIKFLEQNK